MNVYEDIRAERARQIAKGYTADHDDEHNRGELAQASAYYTSDRMAWPFLEPPPWPTRKRRRLVIAAAFLVAEIERLDRLPEHSQ